jgi:spermidine synthase
MFLPSNADIASTSTRLCSQAECLRRRLREKIDNNDLSAALKIAEECIENDCIVSHLGMVQCVDRDPNNDFRPLDSQSGDQLALNNMADVALLTLSDLYMIGEMFLKSQGWFPVDQSSNVSGGIVYEHNETGEVSEEPNYENLSWQMKLMLSIPILIEPGCVDGQVVWAATVVHYQHSLHEEDQYDLECIEGPDENSSCVSVIDVLKSDEEGQSARLRGTYNGCWRGLYAEAVGEMDVAHSLGQVLESWTDTTLAGLSVTNKQSSSNARILVIGLGCGQLVTFLQNHVANVELQVVEASKSMVDIAVKYYQLSSCELDCISIEDPNEYVKSQCLNGQAGDFDTIIVNVCSSDSPFPNRLMNSQFFNGLVSMLSNHPTATLLVNSGVSADAVSLLVGDACKHMYGSHRSGQMRVLREYLLRDHTEGDNEGVIVAARRREWSLTVEDWQREHGGENAQLSGAMDVAKAQRTEVVRLEKFLSKEDIAKIHAVAKTELASIGEATDGALEAHTDSWKVLYLQSNNIFRRKLPALRQRILDAVRQVDKNNWCLFDNVHHVNIRVVEYHQMDESGELADPKHYDLNSLLTMDIMLSELQAEPAYSRFS